LKDTDMWKLLKQYKVVKQHEAPEAQTESQTDRDFIELK
ncbi:cell division protein FtsK, partial [Bacillus cereus]|nr:cell division protein FtsK [Bacillus cereus]